MDNETGQTYASSKQKASEAPHFQPRESVELPEEQIEHQQNGGEVMSTHRCHLHTLQMAAFLSPPKHFVFFSPNVFLIFRIHAGAFS